MATHLEPLMTPVEVAERLRVSLGTIYHLVRDGKLPAIRVGKSLRIAPEDLAEYLLRTNDDGPRVPGGVE